MRGQVGIGTLIVFIAMIVVAAVAGGVLLTTTDTLQSRAISIGSATESKVGSKIDIMKVTGERRDTADNDTLANISIRVQLASGAKPIDFKEVVLSYRTPTVFHNNIQYSATSTGATYFNVTWVRTEVANTVLEPGEIAEILYTFASGEYLGTNTDVEIIVTPVAGTSSSVMFRTPASFAGHYVGLYPPA